MCSPQQCFEGKVLVEQLINEEKFATEFVCQICRTHVVGNNPKLTKCSHMFCGDCLADYFDQNTNKKNGSAPCPVCASSLNKESDVFLIEKSSALLWRMLKGLKIKCASKQGPCVGKCCKWTGEYADYGRHLQAAADASAKVQELEEVIVAAPSTKELPPSPSTCSQCSPALSEESSSDDNGKDSSSEDDWRQSHLDNSIPPISPVNLEEPLGQDLSALIRGWMDLEPDSDALPIAIEGVSAPPPSMSASDAIKSRRDAICEGMDFLVPLPAKMKAKKEKSIQAHVAQSQAQAQASYQWHLYAQYQMAYARQYQMTQMAHAARVHQAMQFQLQQQHLLAQVSR
jgi:hypothetical protein